MGAGQFVWYELLTTDPKAAISFYSEVVGWKTELFTQAGGPEPYTMWVGSQGPLGGVMRLPEEAKKMGAPPHWMAHVEVTDVDATAAKAKQLGGNVYVPPTQIPTVGRFSVIADPQGANLSVFKPDTKMEAHDTSKEGEFNWNELVTSDHEAAFKFYSTLFAWKKDSDFDMGPMGKYLIYGQGEKQYGGMFTKTADMPMPPSCIYYINVNDLEAAVARATSNGGKLMNGPMDVPGGTRIAQLADPQGAFFALHGPAKK
jgi:predicted enzyme related to lactoylglutathione lyase